MFGGRFIAKDVVNEWSQTPPQMGLLLNPPHRIKRLGRLVLKEYDPRLGFETFAYRSFWDGNYTVFVRDVETGECFFESSILFEQARFAAWNRLHTLKKWGKKDVPLLKKNRTPARLVYASHEGTEPL